MSTYDERVERVRRAMVECMRESGTVLYESNRMPSPDELARAAVAALDADPLEDVLPEDWDADVRYEGKGPSTLFGGGEGKYRAFVGPWDAHASGRFEGYGETRAEAIRAAVDAARKEAE